MCRMQPSISQLIRPLRYHHAVARTIRFIHMPPPGCSVSRLISCTQSNTRTTFSCVYTPSAFKQQLHVHVLGMGHSTKSQRLMMGVLAHNPHSMLVQYVGTWITPPLVFITEGWKACLCIDACRTTHALRQAEAEVGEQARNSGVVHDMGQGLPNAPAHSRVWR